MQERNTLGKYIYFHNGRVMCEERKITNKYDNHNEA